MTAARSAAKQCAETSSVFPSEFVDTQFCLWALVSSSNCWGQDPSFLFQPLQDLGNRIWSACVQEELCSQHVCDVWVKNPAKTSWAFWVLILSLPGLTRMGEVSECRGRMGIFNTQIRMYTHQKFQILISVPGTWSATLSGTCWYFLLSGLS